MMEVIEPNTIHERISMLVEHFSKGNKTAFGRETDILPGVLASITGGRLSKPSFELLQKIMTRHPSVNGDWLILGRGPMLKEGSIRVEPASIAYPYQLQMDYTEQAEQILELVKKTVQKQVDRIKLNSMLAAVDMHQHLTAGYDEDLDGLLEEVRQIRLEIEELISEIDSIQILAKPSAQQEKELVVKEEVLKTLAEQLSRVSRAITILRNSSPGHAQYRVSGKPDSREPFDGLLSHRLGIPENEARALVIARKFNLTQVEGTGHYVTESAVREYLRKNKS